VSEEARSGYCDFVIEGGLVIDGTGAPARRADVAVAGDRIAAVGDVGGFEVGFRIDARGRAVAPGFIDVHTHDDRALLSSPDMAPKVSQGVTTVVTGNCGISLAPLAHRDPPPPLNLLGGREWYRFASTDAYRRALESGPPAVNVVMLTGHSTLRAAVMDRLDRPATASEIERMGALLEAALAAGASGLSLGLDYPTARAAPTEELVALARRLPAHGGILTVHLRSEGERLVEALEEALEVGRVAEVPVLVSHHKAAGRANWGKTRETLARIAEARARQRVDVDVYPYTASSTVLLPELAAASERVLIAWSEPHPELAGETLERVQWRWGTSLEAAIERLQPAGAIYHQMHEDDVRRVLAFPGALIGSDGLPHDRFPHPRLWGTFPRVLARYVREAGLLTLEEAVHRMTGAAARVFGLRHRGVVEPGACADLMLFSPESVLDRADFERPERPAAGIDLVIVGGEVVWRAGEPTGARPGRLRGRDW